MKEEQDVGRQAAVELLGQEKMIIVTMKPEKQFNRPLRPEVCA